MAQRCVPHAGHAGWPLVRLWMVLLVFLWATPAALGAGFVTLKDGRFVQDGRTLTPRWATFYPYWQHDGRIEHGSAWADPAFPHYIDAIITMARQAKLNTLRATDFLDGAADWHQATVWTNMDYFIHQAAAHDLHVIISIDAYRRWLIHHHTAPYDPERWTEYLRFFCRRYGRASNILYLPIAGEVPPPNGKDPWKATAVDYLNFYRRMLTMLRQMDPHHLHTVGGLSFLNNPHYGIPWQALFSLPGNDLAAIHIYSPGDLSTSLPMVARWCAEKKLPLVVEEFGARQALGDAARAAYFTRLFTQARAAGAAGIGFWNLGPEIAPTSYEVSPQTPLTFAAVQAAGIDP